MSVVGVDDVEMASMSRPPLTTVRMPKESAGQNAVELLLRKLASGAMPGPDGARLVLPASFIVRGSTARSTRPAARP